MGTSVCLARLQDRRHCSRWIQLDVSVRLGRQVGGYSAIVDGRNDPAACSGCLAVFLRARVSQPERGRDRDRDIDFGSEPGKEGDWSVFASHGIASHRVYRIGLALLH